VVVFAEDRVVLESVEVSATGLVFTASFRMLLFLSYGLFYIMTVDGSCSTAATELNAS
jgi:hypothetical protein